MHIDEILASLVLDEASSTFTAMVSEDWAQGRTLFGGIQAMLAVHAMRLLLRDAPPLWSLQTTFIGPIAPGVVQGKVEVLRAGRSAIQVEARLIADGRCACLVVAVFGAQRASTVRIDPTPANAPEKGVEAATLMPFMPNVVPEFTQHYEYRWAEGGMPFSASVVPGTRIHLRQHDAGTLDETHMVAMADAIPPPTLSLLKQPTPASSLTWSLEFVRHLPPTSSALWWRVDAAIVSARDGYSSQDATIHGPDGNVVALSRQMVALFG